MNVAKGRQVGGVVLLCLLLLAVVVNLVAMLLCSIRRSWWGGVSWLTRVAGGVRTGLSIRCLGMPFHDSADLLRRTRWC